MNPFQIRHNNHALFPLFVWPFFFLCTVCNQVEMYSLSNINNINANTNKYKDCSELLVKYDHEDPTGHKRPSYSMLPGPELNRAMQHLVSMFWNKLPENLRLLFPLNED
ncbi:hypothetical protein GOODEAATRI_033517 [Goodea atripinnis]|uniref:Uncharacterized protein n=1 Tax=Goodea atripinnis TaxID=208336 RepID=A0ABV0NQE6_9TELE